VNVVSDSTVLISGLLQILSPVPVISMTLQCPTWAFFILDDAGLAQIENNLNKKE
jgi:hypothetical protein